MGGSWRSPGTGSEIFRRAATVLRRTRTVILPSAIGPRGGLSSSRNFRPRSSPRPCLAPRFEGIRLPPPGRSQLLALSFRGLPRNLRAMTKKPVKSRRRPTRTTSSASLAEQHVRGLLEYVGEDPEREGLRDTPARVVRSY